MIAHVAAVPNPLHGLWFWIEVHTGIAHGGPDPYYNFWSGLGSDITEVAILGGIIQVFRHRNCHVKHCLRFGKPVSGTPYLACHKHHPDHKGHRRSQSLATIVAAHADALPVPVEIEPKENHAAS